MYVRRAFEKIQTQQKRRHGVAIALIVLLAFGVGTYALYERH